MTISNTGHVEFLRESVVDVDAAVVRIGKDSWIGLPGEKATEEEEAKAMMKTHGFDVLPITDGDEVKRYYCTDKWNDYSSISLRDITHRDVIPSQSGIRDVIKGFAVDKRDFYFLVRERRINGLISIVNLNCRQVKIYLFSLLCELEVRLGAYVGKHVPEDVLLNKGSGGKFQEAKSRYEEDKFKGVDRRFVEYLYLSNLINFTITEQLSGDLGYSSGKQFKKALGGLNELRNGVDHPVSSIVKDRASVKKLWDRVDRIEEALFKLRVI